MKRIIEHVKTHGQKIHSHVKKHHKKYLFGLVSAALLFKIVPLVIASMFTTRLHFSFADDILGLDSPEIVAVEEPVEVSEEESVEASEEESEETPSEETNLDEEDEFNLLSCDGVNYVLGGVSCKWDGSVVTVTWRKINNFLAISCFDNTLNAFVEKNGAIDGNDARYSFEYNGNEKPIISIGVNNGCTPKNYVCHTVNTTESESILEIKQLYPIPLRNLGCTDDELIACITADDYDDCVAACSDPQNYYYVGPSINFIWSGNATQENYSGYQINVYSGDECTGDVFTGVEMGLDDTGITLTGFSSGNYCWSIAASGAELTGTVSTGFTVVDPETTEGSGTEVVELDPVEIQQISPIPGISYTGPSINFEWSGNAQTQFYSGYQIQVYSGNDCSGTPISTTGVALNTTGIALSSFSSGDYCWSIAASGGELTGIVSTGFTVIPESINGECSANDIRIISPLNGEIIRKTKQLSWEFIGDDCDGRKVMVAVNTGGTSNYPVVWSGLIPDNTGYTYDSTGVTEGTLAIYISSGDEKDFSVKQYSIDNLAPTITGVRYEFDRPITGGHFGANHNLTISFTGSEELTGITVNVMGKNAKLDSVRGLKYTYKTSFTGNVNTGTLQFRISYSDLAGNTGSDYTKNVTGLVFDDEAPSISGSIAINLNRGTRKVTIDVSLTKAGKVTLYYNMTGGSSRKSSTSTGYLKNFRWMSSKLKESKRYNYRLLLEDQIGNRRYYGGSFMVTTGGSLQTGNIRTLDSFNTGYTTTSLMTQLRNNLSQYNSCKNRVSTDTLTIALNKNNYNKKLKVEMPDFSSGTLTKKSTTLVATIASSLDDKYRSQGQLDTIGKDLSNYLMVVKLVVDDGNKCKQNMTRMYVTKLLNSLKDAGLIK